MEKPEEPEYPDDIFRIILSHDYTSLDSGYIIKLAPDDLIRTVTVRPAGPEEEVAEPFAYNPFSGSRFLDTVSFIRLATLFYREPANGALEGEILTTRVREHLSRYLTRETTINYSFYLADNTTPAPAALRTEQKLIEVRRQQEWENAALNQRMKFFDTVFKTVAKLYLGTTATESADVGYQYPENVTLFNVGDMVLSPILVFVSDQLKDPNTEQLVFQSKIYDHAKDLSGLLSSVIDYRTSGDGFRLSLRTVGGEYRTGTYYRDLHRLIIPNTHEQVFNTDIPPGYLDEYELNLTISWSLYGIKIDFNLFLQAIMTDPLLRTYLTINDTITPSFMRLRKSINFIYSPSPDETTIYEVTLESQKLYSAKEVTLDTVGTKKMPRDTYHITFTISRLPNRDQVNTVKHILSYLVYYYERNIQPALIDQYTAAFPSYAPNYLIVSQRGAQGGKLISKLQSIDPDKFPEGYARRCLGGQQVDVISQEEYKQLKAEAAQTGEIFSAVKFPRKEDRTPGEQVVTVTCRSKEYPHIGFKRNRDLPNADKYPWIPCCYKKKQEGKKSSGYTRYMNGIPDVDNVRELEQAAARSKEGLQRVDIILPFARKGSIPNIITRVLRNYGLSSEEEPQRFGVYESVNAFIHCVMYAMGNSESMSTGTARKDALGYIEETSLNARETYVAEWRQRIAASGDFDSLKQQLYDYSDEEIRRELDNVYDEFDSTIFVRLLEVYFKLKIYIFVLNYGEYQYPVMEIPRHRYIYIRNESDWPALVIFKHYSDEGTVAYELISFPNAVASGESPYLLSSSAQKGAMFHLFTDMYSLTTYVRHTAYDNIFTFNIHDYLAKLKLRPIAQYLDHYGKCRGYQVEIPLESGVLIGSILTYPQEPVGLRVATEVIPLPFSIVASLFAGNPISRSDVVGAVLRGLWFSINGFELGVYIPIVILPSEEIDDQIARYLSPDMKRASNPLVPPASEKGEFSEFLNIEQRLRKFLSIITWLYRLHERVVRTTVPTKEESKKDNIENHHRQQEARNSALRAFADYFALESEDDIEAQYRLGSISVRDDIVDLDEALAYIEEDSRGTVVRYGKILFGSKKLLTDITYYLENYLLKQPLSFYFTTRLATKATVHRAYERNFHTFEEFESWVAALTRPLTVIVDAEQLTPYRSEPMVYRVGPRGKEVMIAQAEGINVSGATFIIQNVRDGELSRALNISYNWVKDGRKRARNLGYEAPPFQDFEPINYHILEIMGRQLSIKETVEAPVAVRPSGYLYVVRLPTHSNVGVGEYYAAVLPLS